jgi:hypothetical protein
MTSIMTQCFVKGHGKATSMPSPIRVAPKPKSCTTKKARNVFFNDRGFPDKSDEYDTLLHNIDSGVILQKKKFLTPPIDVVNPIFNWEYSDELHGDKLWTNLGVSHLSPEHAAALVKVIKKILVCF